MLKEHTRAWLETLKDFSDLHDLPLIIEQEGEDIDDKKNNT